MAEAESETEELMEQVFGSEAEESESENSISV